jgi:hypothetical protein
MMRRSITAVRVVTRGQYDVTSKKQELSQAHQVSTDAQAVDRFERHTGVMAAASMKSTPGGLEIQRQGKGDDGNNKSNARPARFACRNALCADPDLGPATARIISTQNDDAIVNDRSHYGKRQHGQR